MSDVNIFDLVPGLSEKMDSILRKYEESLSRTTSNVPLEEDISDNMRSYHDSIKNQLDK